ncbi:MAG: ABC transporter substrate-binding protein [Pseudomonadota bacterium]
MDRRFLLTSLALAGPLGFAGCRPANVGPAKVRVQFGWLFDAHHSGFILASEQGLYRDVGLQPSLQPGGTDTNAVKTVVSSGAEIGQAGGIEQIITALSQNLPIRSLAAIHQKTPHALISTSRNPVRQPSDLKGKKIAVAFGDAAEVLLRALLSKSRISIDEVTLVPFRFDLTPLLLGQVDVITGFRTDQPATIRSKGQDPVTLAYDDFGIESYGYTLFAKATPSEVEHDQMARFLTASREGWTRAFNDPGAAIAALTKFVGGPVDKSVEEEKLKLLRDIMLDPTGKLAAWTATSERIKTVVGYLESAGQLKGISNTADLVQRAITAT